MGSMGCYTGSNGNPTPSSCLYASDDGGRTWQDLEAGRLVDPSFADASHGVATSYWEPWEKSLSAPQLYATSDGGHSWQVQPDPCGPDYPLARSGRRRWIPEGGRSVFSDFRR